MYGAYYADADLPSWSAEGPEAGLFLVSEHIQHLARIGLKVPCDAIDTFGELPEFRRHDPEVLRHPLEKSVTENQSPAPPRPPGFGCVSRAIQRGQRLAQDAVVRIPLNLPKAIAVSSRATFTYLVS